MISAGGFWIASSQLALLLSNFLLLKLLTNAISVEDFGHYSLYMTVVLFIRLVGFDPLSMVIAKRAASRGPGVQRRSTIAALNIMCDKTAMAVLLCVVALTVASRHHHVLLIALIFSALYLLGNGAQGVYFNVLNSLGMRQQASMLAILDSVLKIALAAAFLLVLPLPRSFEQALMPVALGALITLAVTRSVIRRSFPAPSCSSSRVGRAAWLTLLMSAPLFVPAGLNAIRTVGDRWLLTAAVGVEELAAYSVLLQIGYFPVMLLVGVAQTYLAPSVYAMCATHNANRAPESLAFIRKTLLVGLSAASVGSVISYGAADFALRIMTGPEYLAYAAYLPAFVVAGFLAAIGSLLQLVAFASFSAASTAKLSALSAILVLLTTAFFIYFNGFFGAVVGLAFAGVITVLTFVLALVRHHRRDGGVR
jgi:O-antigen/teichoic acid export membrane protein